MHDKIRIWLRMDCKSLFFGIVQCTGKWAIFSKVYFRYFIILLTLGAYPQVQAFIKSDRPKRYVHFSCWRYLLDNICTLILKSWYIGLPYAMIHTYMPSLNLHNQTNTVKSWKYQDLYYKSNSNISRGKLQKTYFAI